MKQRHHRASYSISKILKNMNKFYLLILGMLVVFQSCEKENQEPLDIYDESNFYHEESDIMQDVESLFWKSKAFENTNGGCAISDIDSNTYHKYIITYNDTTCDGKFLWNGTITVSLSNGKWSDKDAIISVVFENFKEKNLIKGWTTVLNGEKVIRNISGGVSDNLSTGDSVIREVEGKSLSLKYEEDDTYFRWDERRLKIIKNSGGTLEFIYQGNSLKSASSDIVAWGTKRNGTNFHTFIETPMIERKCGARYRMIGGVKVVHTDSKVTRIKYGVDKIGVSVNDCSAYGYALSWKNTGGKFEDIIVKE